MQEKLIAELREWWKITQYIEDEMEIGTIRKFNDILSRLSAEQGADKGGQGLREYCSYFRGDMPCGEREFCRIKECPEGFSLASKCSRPKQEAVEPLACLADRHGWFISMAVRMGKTWRIEIDGAGKERNFRGDTYAAAEEQARAYLLALPNADGKKD